MLASFLFSKQSTLCFLALIHVIIIGFWYFGFEGYDFYDDLGYAKYAYHMSQGNFQLDASLFSHRVAVISFTALIYKLLGYSDWTTNLPPLLWTLFTLNLLFWVWYKRHAWIALLMAALFGLDFYVVFFSNKLYPDGLVCAATFTAAILLWKVRTETVSRPGLYAFLFILSLWIAFLAKVTVFYTLPFFFSVWVYDLIHQKNLLFWKTALIAAILSVLGAGVFYYTLFGDLFYRFEAIFNGHYVSPNSYFDKDGWALLKRLSYEPFVMFMYSGMIIVLVLAFPALGGWKRGRWFVYAKEERYWVGYTLIILFFFWFGSTSLRYYNPIALFARHLLLIVPPLALLGGKRLWKLNDHAGMYACLFALVTIVSWLLQIGNQMLLYLLLTGFFGVVFINARWKVWKVSQKTGYLFFLIILFIHPVYSMQKPPATSYRAMKEALFTQQPLLQDALVITDYLTSTHLPHLFDYQIHPASTDFGDEAIASKMDRYSQVFLLVYQHHLFPDQAEALNRLLEGRISLEKLHPLVQQKGFRLYQIQVPEVRRRFAPGVAGGPMPY